MAEEVAFQKGCDNGSSFPDRGGWQRKFLFRQGVSEEAAFHSGGGKGSSVLGRRSQRHLHKDAKKSDVRLWLRRHFDNSSNSSSSGQGAVVVAKWMYVRVNGVHTAAFVSNAHVVTCARC